MFYAKSFPKETIAEHTNRLLEQLEVLKKSYGQFIEWADERFWNMLELAIRFHDAGKANVLFQNKIRQKWGAEQLPTSLRPDQEIPHNYVSVALLPYSQLDYSPAEWKLLVEAIGYHHERDAKPDMESMITFVKQAKVLDWKQDIYHHLSLDYDLEKTSLRLLDLLVKRDQREGLLFEDIQAFKRHVLLKGFLHRIDHSASAHVQIERGIDEDTEAKAKKYLEQNKYELAPAQHFAAQHQDKHTFIVASTGSGKTEAALMWIGKAKGFITLPLRVSLNAMYVRLKSTNNVSIESLGLLHSGSFDVLVEEDNPEGVSTYDHSRQLSEKLMLTTIDQVLKFPFYYKGFEKELSVFSYAKLVIDEIQAYDPHIAAMLLKAIQLIDRMGGKVLVMTATLPQLFLETIERENILPQGTYNVAHFPNETLKRHRYELVNHSIVDLSEQIVEASQSNKILVICNTVDRAIEVYRRLQNELDQSGVEVPLHLLHARFTKQDKRMLEEHVMNFAGSGWHKDKTYKQPGIWVTTQIVEASLDVDFDLLFTELCPLDSLFQRMGRCYRIRNYELSEPNVYIATEEVSGVGSVYDEKIVEFSESDLFDGQYELMSESKKMELVANLYTKKRLQGTRYLRKFNDAIEFFKSKKMFETKVSEAQEMLRDIKTVTVIPEAFQPEVQPLLDRFEKTQDREERRSIRKKVENWTVSISQKRQQYQKLKLASLNVKGLDNLYWITEADATYTFDAQQLAGTGLIFEQNTHFI